MSKILIETVNLKKTYKHADGNITLFNDLNLKKQTIDLQKLNFKEYMFDIKKINKQIRNFNNENTKNVREFIGLIESLKRTFQKEV